MTLKLITPHWPAPARVKAFTTTRAGGFSEQPFNSLNLGDHCGDDNETVNRNRNYLRQEAHLPAEPLWLNQVHSTLVINAEQYTPNMTADAVYSQQSKLVCAVMTADCLPVLLCDRNAQQVAAIHAGWRGLAAGIIETTIAQLKIPGSEILAWLGPAIGPTKFEIGPEVRQEFVNHDPAAEQAFQPGLNDRWLANMYSLAKQRLLQCDVSAIYGGEFCTYTESDRFFSYRRDQKTGRMASLIWLE